MDFPSTASGASAPKHPLRPYYEGNSPAISFGTASPPGLPGVRNATFTPLLTPKPDFGTEPENYIDLNVLSELANNAVNATLMAFTGTALVMPFEVGKTLCQVQWVPRTSSLASQSIEEILPEENEALDEANLEEYFQSIGEPSLQSESRPRPTSPSGYISRTDVNDLSTKPPWILPVPVHGGVWDMMRGVTKFEGWLSMFRGLVTTTISDSITSNLQPILFTCLSVFFLPSRYLTSALLPLIYSPHPRTMLAVATLSHALTTLAVSPLDLVRTRLIVQSSQEKTYTGPIDALQKITKDEGGLWTTYFHPTLLVPTLLEGIFRPLIQLSTPLIISRFFRIEPSTAPVLFCLAELCMSSIGLLVTLPIETVRKRLQIQSRKPSLSKQQFKTTIETRPTPYAGVLDCVYCIVTEETGGDAAKSSLRQLYRGLGMGLATNTIVCVLGLIAGRTEEAVGWAEV